jgi:hypothetical protein
MIGVVRANVVRDGIGRDIVRLTHHHVHRPQLPVERGDLRGASCGVRAVNCESFVRFFLLITLAHNISNSIKRRRFTFVLASKTSSPPALFNGEDQLQAASEV